MVFSLNAVIIRYHACLVDYSTVLYACVLEEAYMSPKVNGIFWNRNLEKLIIKQNIAYIKALHNS